VNRTPEAHHLFSRGTDSELYRRLDLYKVSDTAGNFPEEGEKVGKIHRGVDPGKGIPPKYPSRQSFKGRAILCGIGPGFPKSRSNSRSNGRIGQRLVRKPVSEIVENV